jgi:cardiolipin synthase
MVGFAFLQLGSFGYTVLVIFESLAALVSFFIINRDFNPAYKISWILTVLLIPLAGTGFYILFGRARMPKKMMHNLNTIINKNVDELVDDRQTLSQIEDLNVQRLSNYIRNTTGKQAFNGTQTKLLTPGEIYFEKLKEELWLAKKFIFMESFIVQEGKMWNGILEILVQKIKEGIDVRFMYDDFGCINKVPYNFKKKLEKLGLKVVNFNPFRPKLSLFMNYRDHRKITVIDGNVGFIGGANIADLYINEVNKFGHWKDSTLMIKGQAVWNLTLLFLQTWEFSTKILEDYEQFKPTTFYEDDGIVHVFGDSPISGHLTTENTYISIISNAKKYVYITTPYLIIDNELLTALKTSAISGVDVSIIVPHIPDKKVIFYVTQSYYKELIKAGVKIYEYLPGFCHVKSIVSDDVIAMIGTANLDYRSLYLHFEASCLIYKSKAVKELVTDTIKTINLSKQISYEETKSRSIIKKAIAFFLRALSPLM